MRQSAFFVGGWFGNLAVPGRWRMPLPPLDSPDWDALERHNDEQTQRMCATAALFLVGLVLLWWPFDYLAIQRPPEQQRVFNVWRLSTIAIFGSMYLAMRYVPVLRRNPTLGAAPFSTAGCFALTYFLGTFGGLDKPYFFMSCAALIVPILAPGPFFPRLGFLTGLSLGLVGGFFLPHPERFSSPLLGEAISFLICIYSAAFLIGHAMYIAFCNRFFQGLAFERMADELADLNRDLGDRVREKTADLRQLAEHLQVVQEEERGRISRELHDELGQRLSALRYVVATARRRFARAPTTIGPNLAELDTMIEGALGSAHHIVSGLRPPVLEQLGLRSAIEWLTLRTSERIGLGCELDLGEDRPCDDPVVSVAAFRVLQESLTNVARHAQASRIEVRLSIAPDVLQLAVIDDGRGFPDADAAPSNRNGLLGMRERARALGGELVTDNVPTGGARVRLQLPMTAPQEATP